MSRISSLFSNNPVAKFQNMGRRLSPAELQMRLAMLQAGFDREARQDSSRRGDQRFQLLLESLKGNQRAQNEARNANESRYNDILQLYGVTRGDVLGDLENLGGSQRSDINRRWDMSRNNLITDLAERGMAGSTARIPIEASTNEGRGREMERLEDLLRERRAGVKERFVDRAGGTMERRTDAYPDLSSMAGLAGMIGQLDEPPVDSYNLSAMFPALMQGALEPPVERPIGQRASLPGTSQLQQMPRDTVYAGQPTSAQPAGVSRAVQDQMSQQELERRRALVAIKNARESRGGVPGGAIGREREAQNAALLAGMGDWSAGQRAPTIPGAHPNLLPDSSGGDATPYLAQLLQQMLGGYGQPAHYSERPVRPNTLNDRRTSRRAAIERLQQQARTRRARNNLPAQMQDDAMWAGL
jgi:hypothetical protein